MRLTQGAFSYLPDLTDEEIAKQLDHCIANGWAIAVEHTDVPHPRHTYWEMWGLPMFDRDDPAGILAVIDECRSSHPEHYVRVNALDDTHGVESVVLSFIVQRPTREPGLTLLRQKGPGRVIHYTIVPDDRATGV